MATVMGKKLDKDPKQAVRQIMTFIKAPTTEWQVGKTKVCVLCCACRCCLCPCTRVGCACLCLCLGMLSSVHHCLYLSAAVLCLSAELAMFKLQHVSPRPIANPLLLIHLHTSLWRAMVAPSGVPAQFSV